MGDEADHAPIDPVVKESRRVSFGAYAALYDRVRPGWSSEVLDWLLGSPPGSLDVIDLGCGTGKGTRTLLELGHHVTAIDPSAEMIAVLRAGSRATAAAPEPAPAGRLSTLVAGAEDLPLADASADAIVCLQAWHWVQPDAAARECARVLRRGGLLGLAWHRPDTSIDWVVELNRRAEQRDMGGPGEPLLIEGFERVSEREFAHVQPLSVEDLVAQVSSWSHVAISPRRDAILASVRQLGLDLADAQGRVHLPYLTDAGRARRRD